MALREYNKWIYIGIAAVVILVAGFITAYLLLRPHSKTVVQVNGVTITQADIDSQTAFPLSQTPGIFDANGGAANKKDIDQRNLNAAINQQLLLQEAKKRSIKISNQAVDAAYNSIAKSYPSQAELQDKLKQAGMTEAQLKTAVTDNLTISALTKSLIPDASATAAKLQDYYNSHKDRYAGAGSFADLKDEIKADYLNDARTSAVDALVAQLLKTANIKE